MHRSRLDEINLYLFISSLPLHQSVALIIDPEISNTSLQYIWWAAGPVVIVIARAVRRYGLIAAIPNPPPVLGFPSPSRRRVDTQPAIEP